MESVRTTTWKNFWWSLIDNKLGKENVPIRLSLVRNEIDFYSIIEKSNKIYCFYKGARLAYSWGTCDVSFSQGYVKLYKENIVLEKLPHTYVHTYIHISFHLEDEPTTSYIATIERLLSGGTTILRICTTTRTKCLLKSGITNSKDFSLEI